MKETEDSNGVSKSKANREGAGCGASVSIVYVATEFAQILRVLLSSR